MAGTEMMMMMKAMCVALVLAAVFAPPTAEAALGCPSVIGYLAPCFPYVTRGAPLGRCCGGVRGLYNAAKTTPDRQSVCSCLKGLAGTYRVNLVKAAGLPRICRVYVPYKISPSTDCSRVR